MPQKNIFRVIVMVFAVLLFQCGAFAAGHAAIDVVSRASLSHNMKKVNVVAVWDTGAQISCISHRVVQMLNLSPRNRGIVVNTPTGQMSATSYLVDVTLTNGVTLHNVEVLDTHIGDTNTGLLIGMDIIGQGAFSLNAGQRPSFTIDNTVIPLQKRARTGTTVRRRR